jgi:hypothetical protein
MQEQRTMCVNTKDVICICSATLQTYSQITFEVKTPKSAQQNCG